MAKFTFPIPGRNKKQAPPPVPSEASSKAHRILGSAQPNVDSFKAWDDASNAGISVDVSESSAQPTHSAGKGAARRNRPPREWGDESDVVPQHLRPGAAGDGNDTYSDYSSALREQASSSTIRSWYDRTKQPLSISQQTSASAMAKGLPSKAHRLLDVDNAYANPSATPKAKKKPSKLDLSHLKLGGRNKTQEWEGPVLGNDYVMQSPSVVSQYSPPTPGGSKGRRRIQKRNTQENLAQHHTGSASRPTTSGSVRRPPSNPANRLDELPILYKHYEQMSFAQMMGGDENQPDKGGSNRSSNAPQSSSSHNSYSGGPLPSTTYRPQQHKQRRSEMNSLVASHPTQPTHSSHNSHSTQRGYPTQAAQAAHSNYISQMVHASAPLKPEPKSPTDYAASVSSRHTRTSRASKRTERSFPASDLQDTSVLMLSSDSEEEEVDTYSEYSAKNSTSTGPGTRRPSLIGTSSALTVNTAQPPSHKGKQPSQSGQPTQTSKRIPSAPAGFLTIPTHLASKTPSPSSSPGSSNARESSQWGQTGYFPATPDDASLSNKSTSSKGTSETWQSQDMYSIQEARAVTMVSAQAPASNPEQIARDYQLQHQQPQPIVRNRSSIPVSPKTQPARPQPTPPISPHTSVDYSTRNQQSAAAAAHEHVMGLTRQEQMLIQALRQRREAMGKTSPPSGSPETVPQSQQPRTKGHQCNQSNSSEATITEETFNLTFPAPPSRSSSAMARERDFSISASTIDLPVPGDEDDDDFFRSQSRSQSRAGDNTVFILSPPPSSHHKASNSINKISGNLQGSQKAQNPAQASIDGAVHSHSRTRSSSGRETPQGNNSRESLTVPRPSPGSVRRQSSLAKRHERAASRNQRRPSEQRLDNWVIAEEEPTVLPAPQHHHKHSEGKVPEASSEAQKTADGPRPDSPVSPIPMAEDFPAVPTKRQTLNNQGARLSAFGPPQGFTNGSFGWWGDED